MKGTKSALPTPSGDDPTKLTDWCEALMLLKGESYLSRSAIRARLRNTAFVDSGTGDDDLTASDLDVALDCILGEVQRRRRCGGTAYPFNVEGEHRGVSVATGSELLIYAFLLLICVSPSMRTDKRHSEVDQPFDKVALLALRNYLGPRCKGLRFGSPASDGRPTRFRDAIRWLAAQTGVRQGKAEPRSHSGDGGADLVAWLPFDDQKEGFLFVLAQCTVQLEWHNKGKDIVADRWTGWLDLGKHPTTCLAVPFAVAPDEDRWDEIRRTTHLVLDRIRLIRQSSELPIDLKKTIRAWVVKEANRLGGSANVFLM